MSNSMKRGPRDYLPPRLVTEIIHRVCIRGEPIKAVAMDNNLNRDTVQNWVNKYEAREAA